MATTIPPTAAPAVTYPSSFRALVAAHDLVAADGEARYVARVDGTYRVLTVGEILQGDVEGELLEHCWLHRHVGGQTIPGGRTIAAERATLARQRAAGAAR